MGIQPKRPPCQTRVVFKAGATTPAVAQTSDYYPFGQTFAPMVVNNTANKYLYKGKELQDDKLAGSSLNMLDYGARFYDAQIGRWVTSDPLCEDGGQESLTQYHYVLNNPVKNTDPDGRIALVDNLAGAAIGLVTDYTCQVMANRIANPDQSWSTSLTDISYGSLAVSTFVGALTSGASAVETVSASIAKAGVNKAVANVAVKATVGAVQEGTGQALDNVLKGKPVMEGVAKSAALGAVVKQLEVKTNNHNAETTIARYGNGKATTSGQVNMVKDAASSIKTNKILEKTVNTATNIAQKTVDKKIP